MRHLGLADWWLDRNLRRHELWAAGIFASVVVYFSSIKSLFDFLGFTLSVSAARTVACIFWSNRTDDTGSSRTMFSVVAFIYVASTIGLAILSVAGRPQQLIGSAITIVSGFVAYTFMTALNRPKRVR